jgi:class 3 adenylate cyclase
MLVFGAPLAASDDPERAVACAVEMQNKIRNKWIAAPRRAPEIVMGIGINTGRSW